MWNYTYANGPEGETFLNVVTCMTTSEGQMKEEEKKIILKNWNENVSDTSDRGTHDLRKEGLRIEKKTWMSKTLWNGRQDFESPFDKFCRFEI